MAEFVFRSSLPATYHRALEELVFFNPRQRAAEAGITQAVDLYGTPALEDDGSGLRVVVGKRSDAQCLFALADCDPELPSLQIQHRQPLDAPQPSRRRAHGAHERADHLEAGAPAAAELLRDADVQHDHFLA